MSRKIFRARYDYGFTIRRGYAKIIVSLQIGRTANTAPAEEERVTALGTAYAVKMENVTKRFGKVVANNAVNLELREGEILSLLGENGSGKTTLMNMLSGIYFPDEGQIYIHGKPVTIASPKDAFNLGIGMIHQHFKLVDVFTATENIVLGLEGKLNLAEAGKKVREICEKYGFDIDPDQKIYDMSVTHKLHEVLDVSDRVAVLRKGEYIGDVATRDADQQSLTDMMVGHSVTLNIDRPEPVNVTPRLVLDGLTVYDELGVKRLDNVSFTVNAGEVLGVAGVAGSGQRELLESIAGLYPIASGTVTYYDPKDGKTKNLVGMDPMDIRKHGIAMSFVPEDRLGMGLVGSMGMTGNMMLRSWRKGHGVFLNRKDPEDLAKRIWQELDVVTPSTNFPVRRMSGGNVQKVLVGREIAQAPSVLMTAYAVRGLDINTSYTIYNLLTEQKMKGIAVVYVGEDLDVLLELCDRIVVLCGGQVSGVVDARTADKRQVGALMTQMEGGKADE